MIHKSSIAVLDADTKVCDDVFKADDDNKGPTEGSQGSCARVQIYISQHVTTSGATAVQCQPPQGPGLQVPAPGAPSPHSIPVRFAPSIPLGMTSLGSRTPAMEGCYQVGSGIEPGAPQRVEPSAPPDYVNPRNMVTTLNSDRGHTVCVAPPPVATKALDAPQVHRHLLPSPLSLPPGPPVHQRGEGVEPGGDYQRQAVLQRATYEDQSEFPSGLCDKRPQPQGITPFQVPAQSGQGHKSIINSTNVSSTGYDYNDRSQVNLASARVRPHPRWNDVN